MLSFIKKVIPYVFAIIISLGVVTFLHINNNYSTEPKELYKVYIDGKSIGNIKSKKEYENYINKKQEEIRKKYGVSKVHAPSGVDIQKVITYEKKVLSVRKIDEIIKNKKPFTIKAYRVTINKKENNNEENKEEKPIYINVLKKDLFENSVNRVVEAFIGREKFLEYKNNLQKEIVTTGSVIENLYLGDNITIKEMLISTNEQIFIDENSLTKYLLFGTLKEDQYYVVKPGDMIEQITYNNKLSLEEFLVVNPEFKKGNIVLSEGQKVKTGLISPVLNVTAEKTQVSDEDINFETQYEYDSSLSFGTKIVKIEGQKGVIRITSKLIEVNNEVQNLTVDKQKSVVIKEAINKVIVLGTYYTGGGWSDDPAAYAGDGWAWPTIRPYMITSGFGWRWGTMHNAIDISGCGYGSPIYAANNGVVSSAHNAESTDIWSLGGYVIINHQNGYFTLYAHLSSTNISVGSVVKKGQKIGEMGHSGRAYGTHLHFGVYKGMPYRGGVGVNPLGLYN